MYVEYVYMWCIFAFIARRIYRQFPVNLLTSLDPKPTTNPPPLPLRILKGPKQIWIKRLLKGLFSINDQMKI